ncbi:hypothetical protein ILUMI_07079 [Ignelater luminosus]|uniref:Ubiquitin-conjugating enzyme E2 J1 n=1 Tax=Ignelater luminosus TaxID=2038154 RepID=A0A8K0D439_IGNLU|nr:hypothetical protein ILUMI_07079 [Ignelater luminosus]
MPTPAAGTIGSLDYTKEERQVLAKRSKTWECNVCGMIADKLSTVKSTIATPLTQEETSLISQIALKAEEETAKNSSKVEVGEPESEIETIVTSGVLRQRGVTNEPNRDDSFIPDELLRASIERTNKDKLWSAVIWVLISLIVLLVIRRFFFL